MIKKIYKKRTIGLIGTSVGLAGLLLATAPTGASATTSSTSSAGAAGPAGATWHAYSQTGFSGPGVSFSGATGACVYVGADWNDRIRSARTNSDARVELWDNYNCTGGAIVIDASGYGSIGAWVSAYRVTYP
jgi:hypothetical protein